MLTTIQFVLEQSAIKNKRFLSAQNVFGCRKRANSAMITILVIPIFNTIKWSNFGLNFCILNLNFTSILLYLFR